MGNEINSYRDTYDSGYQYNVDRKKNSGQNYDMLFVEKEQSVSVDDFLNLMVAQLKNQDFMNPVDDTQFVAQLAQFASMQQMQELAAYSKQNYVSSLLGKKVTASKFTVSGDLDTETGTVQKVTLSNNEYGIYVNGKQYSLDQIMELHEGQSETSYDASVQNITKVGTSDRWIEIEWPFVSSDPGVQKNLKYSVYYSEEPLGSTVEDIMKNGTLSGLANRPNINTDLITGLKANTDYYISVIVEDPDGNKTAYKTLTARTELTGSEGTETA